MHFHSLYIMEILCTLYLLLLLHIKYTKWSSVPHPCPSFRTRTQCIHARAKIGDGCTETPLQYIPEYTVSIHF